MQQLAAGFEQAWGSYLERFHRRLHTLVSDWETARARVWNTLAFRFTSLTADLDAALGRLQTQVGTLQDPSRRKAVQVFEWLRDFDSERARVERAVWRLLADARRDSDAAWRGLQRELLPLERVGVQTARAAEQAIDRTISAGDARLDRAGLGRDMSAGLEAALAALRADMDRWAEMLRRDLGGQLSMAYPDLSQVMKAFSAQVMENLGESGVDLSKVTQLARRPAARAPARRKRAPLPGFILGRFYKRGSLVAGADGTQLSFVNPIAFSIISNADPLVVDGRPFPKEDTILESGERRMAGNELSPQSYLKFPKGGELKATLRGLKLQRGEHQFRLSVELRKLGWIEITVKETV